MKSKEVMNDLSKIAICINNLFEKTTSSSFDDLDENIQYEDDPNDRMLSCEIYYILEKLDDVKHTLDYINKNVKSEGCLMKNSNDRYELNNFEFHCGYSIEALIYDSDIEKDCWVHSRIEHDGERYYLVGHNDLVLDGVRARIRY
ncbi:DUF5348 domain-containing protein [Sedimentibacter sp. zth1]|uniref:DUF5348 domain-containing protein n=1 Tax=Sedimentibacter sp. zth1 TaxID=2816908 RepID=UPI001A93A501|nr:DUF5348 domain-containing protein [Sedimentibacter sp. zth1]QSX05451.1 DUF5348 domain-containing protein [Sedimentibacter sp. zth1]